MYLLLIILFLFQIKADDSGICESNCQYSFIESTGTLTISGNGQMSDYEPDDQPWNSYKDKITKVVIEDEMKTIGKHSFYGCHNLKSISIGKSVQIINLRILQDCYSLETVFVNSENTNFISDHDVLLTKDKSIVIQFPTGKNMKSYTIPKEVVMIEEKAFFNCTYLEEIKVENGNPTFSSIDGVLFSVQSSRLIQYPSGRKERKYSSPQTTRIVETNSFTGNTYLEALILNTEISELQTHICDYCSQLRMITIPFDLMSFEVNAFYECYSIKTVYYYGSSICPDCDSSFINTNIEKIFVPNTFGGSSIFSFPTIKISSQCGTNCFYSFVPETKTLYIVAVDNVIDWSTVEPLISSIEIMEIPFDLSPNDGQYIKKFIQLKTLILGSKTIPVDSFYGVSIETLKLLPSIERIEESAFRYCHQLKTITIYEHSLLKSIGKFSFKDNINLKTISLPETIDSIDFMSVFDGCKSLWNIVKIIGKNDHSFYTINDNNIILKNDKKSVVFIPQGVSKSSKLILPHSVETLEKEVGTGNNFETIQLSKNIKSIPQKAFYNNYNTKQLIIPPSVNIIETMAYAFNEELEEIIIFSNTIELNSFAFIGCKKLKRIVFIGSTITFQQNTFNGCSLLNEIQVIDTYENNSSPSQIQFTKGNIRYNSCGHECYYLLIKDSKELYVDGNNGNLTSIQGLTDEEKQIVKKVYLYDGIIKIEDSVFDTFKNVELIEIKGIYQPECSKKVFSKMKQFALTVEDDKTSFCGYSTNYEKGYVTDSILFVRTRSNDLFMIGEGEIPDYDFEKTIPPYNSFIQTINDIFIGKDITRIGDRAFKNSSVSSYSSIVSIPSSVRSIGINPFSMNNKLYTFDLHDNTHFIFENGMLMTSDKTELICYLIRFDQKHIIDLPKTLKTIRSEAFVNLPTLELLMIPENIETIHYHAILSCSNLKSIYFYGPQEPSNISSSFQTSVSLINVKYNYKNNTFGDLSIERETKVPFGDLYYSIDSNSQFLIISGEGEMLDYEQKSEKINSKTVYYSTAPWVKDKVCPILSLIVEEGVSTIGKNAFYGCQSLNTIHISKTVTTIETSAFESCSQLTNINLQNGIKTLGESAFKSCFVLTTFYFPASLESIHYSTFSSCSNLQSFTVDEKNLNFSTIEGVLVSYDKKKFIHFPKSAPFFDTYAIPDGIEIICQEALTESNYLEFITIPASVIKIEPYAFANNPGLSDVSYLGTNEPECDKHAFDNCPYYDGIPDVPNGFVGDFCGAPI